MDGNIDYSGCSLAELREVESSIDQRRFPKNYENLRSVIEQRLVEEPPVSPEPTEESPSNDWATTEGPDNYRSLPKKDLVRSVAVFVVAVLAQSVLIPTALAEYDVPVGRWVRLIYYTNAGILVAHFFALKYRRLYYFNEVTELMGASFGTIILLEIVGSIFLLPYVVDTSLITGFVAITSIISFLLLIAFDALLLYLAFEFPVRWFMRWKVRGLQS
jgi:hypothetical protein